LDLDKVMTVDDLVHSNEVFLAATGITTSGFLRGVQYFGHGATTHSIVMRSASGTVRYVEATHHFEKLMAIAELPYEDADLRKNPRMT
jgi:fructose-1,6-bisphosphatase II